MLKRIVLLPGLDGTGQLFSAFIAALPKTITASAVTYPPNKLLSYAELLPLVKLAIPEFEPFVLFQEVRQVLKSVSPEVLSDRVCMALKCDARSALAKTVVPVLYLEATQDNLLADSCVDQMKRIKPNISINQVVGPHLLLQREPQKVAEILFTFIRGLES